MDNLRNVLKNRGLLIVLAIACFIWFLGPYLAFAGYVPFFTTANRLSAISIIVLVWSFINMTYTHDNSESTKENQSNAESDGDTTIKQLLAIFKYNRRFFKRKSYYLLIGPSGSGKTSLLLSAGLEQTENTKLDDALSNWPIAEKMVLDITGCSLSDTPDNPNQTITWKKIVDAFKKNKFFHSLDGIIVSISLQQLYHLNRNQQLKLINQISQQLKQVTDQLGQIPISITYTKCDLIEGFNEYFDAISSEEREKPWGMTFNTPCHKNNFAKQFHQQFDLFISNVNQNLLPRLHHQRNAVKRAKIKDFCLQLDSLKSTLEGIGSQLMSSANIKLNGIYLTSSLQRGTPIDYLIQPMIEEMSVSQAVVSMPVARIKPYFVKQLMAHATRYTSASTNQYRKQANYIRYGITSIMIALAATAMVAIYQQNITTINAAYGALNDSTQFNQTNPNHNYAYLSTLSTLNQALTKMQDEEKSDTNITLPETKSLHKRLNKTYQALLIKSLAPQLQEDLEYNLRDNTKSLATLYSSLKIYLMLSNQIPLDAHFTEQWFNRYWQQQNLSDTEITQLDTHLDNLLTHTHYQFQAKSDLIATARNALNNADVSDYILATINSSVNLEPQLTLTTTGNLFVHQKQNVPAAYTAKNLNRIYNQIIPQSCEGLLSGDVIIGIKASNQLSITLPTLIQQTQLAYLKHYKSTWQHTLQNLKLQPFNNLAQANATIRKLINQPTQLAPVLNQIQTNIAILSTPQFESLVGNRFDAVNQLTDHSKSNVAWGYLKQLNGYLADIQYASNHQKAAFMAARYRMLNTANADPIAQLYNYASQDATANPWLLSIANNSWQLILNNAKNYINNAWVSTVVPDYNNHIQNRFPIYDDSPDDIDLAAFTKFFGPSGTLTTFFNQYLAPFANTQKSYWTWKSVEGQTIGIDRSNLDMFIRASLITQMFFPDNSQTPQAQFSLTPIAVEPSIEQFTLELGKQIANYDSNQGPQVSQLSWPTPDKLSAAIAFVNTMGNTTQEHESGPWALLRILKKTNIHNVDNSKTFQVTFDLNGNAAKYELLANNTLSPFIPNITNQFRCPPNLG